jgi:membrane protein required for colicin V production
MNLVDVFLLCVLIVSVVIGMFRGLVYEVLATFGWVASFWLAQRHALLAGDWLPLEGASEPVRLAAGFLVVLVSCMVLFGLLAVVGKKLMQTLGLSPVDRTLGAGFGLARGLVALLAVTVVAGLTPLGQHAAWQGSQGAGLLRGALVGLKPLLPQPVAGYL